MEQLFSGYPVVDIRDELPRAKGWSIGQRGDTTSQTWHWNGPAIPEYRQKGGGLIDQLILDARYHMRPGWGGTKHGADGLMYHFIVDLDGVAYQARDLGAMLWHCGHQDGNSRGIAIHFPRGRRKDGKPEGLALPQVRTACLLSDALCLRYNLGRSRVFGHLEWKHATDCPGRAIMDQLNAYRGGRVIQPAPTQVPGLTTWKVLKDQTLVRQGPGREFPEAGRLKAGTLVWVDVVKDGEAVDGNTDWVHMARVPAEQADLGFISGTLVQQVS